MKLVLNQSVEAFDQQSAHAYPFVTHNNTTTEEPVVFFPDERLLYVPTLMTAIATGLMGIFIALLTFTVVSHNNSYFRQPGGDETGFAYIPIIVFAGLFVVTLILVVVARRNLARRRTYLQAATTLRNGYKEGLYFLEEGLILRTANRVDAIPYDHIRFVRRLTRKHVIGKNVHLPEVHYLDESGLARKLNITSMFYSKDEDNLWNRLQERDIEVRDER